MANEVSANPVLAHEVLAPLPEVALSEPDYRAFCAALEASARGRAFLAEFARRNRHADTETVLAALERLETLVRGQAAPAREPSALPPEVAALVMVDGKTVEVARSHLAVVPSADEPELPIPAPAAGPPPAIALVQATPVQEVTPPAPDIIQRSAAIIPEVNMFDGAPAQTADAAPAPPKQTPLAPTYTPLIPAQAGIQESNRSSEDVDSGSPLARGRADNPAQMETALVTEIAATPPPVFELTLSPPAVKTPAAPPIDPLAHIMALSDEERIALFS